MPEDINADRESPTYGRPGHLTPLQESKLQEFWVTILKALGSIDAKQATELNEDAGVTPITRVDTTKSTKSKKGFSLWGGGSRSSEPPAEEDKYGQNKIFDEALAKLGPTTLRKAFWSALKHDNPDALVLRYLRARKWDVNGALVMLISTLKWRVDDMKIDSLMEGGEESLVQDALSTDPKKQKVGNDIMAQHRMGKSFLHGIDKMQRTMCFIRVRLHKIGAQSQESLQKYVVFQIETGRLMLNPGTDTVCLVFDMTDFSLANMDYTPIQFIVKCFEANYAETLGVVLIHRAPWIFQGIWKVIRGWLDPVVAAKVNFTNNEQEMEQFIEASKMMKELGGEEQYEYSYVEPQPGENDAMKDTATKSKLQAERDGLAEQYEQATVGWIKNNGAEREAAQAKRDELAEALRVNYWKLDPYVRARSFYDRKGMIRPGGQLDFYPGEEKAGSSTVAANGTGKTVETAEVQTSVEHVETAS